MWVDADLCRLPHNEFFWRGMLVNTSMNTYAIATARYIFSNYHPQGVNGDKSWVSNMAAPCEVLRKLAPVRV